MSKENNFDRKALFLLITICFSQSILSSNDNYVFGWTQLNNPDLMTPRGGTSSGPDVDLDETPNPFWRQIQDDELTKFEKDRLAILAMQGEHKINFDFMETMGFVENYMPSKPYQSWGTEFVIAVEDEKDFISLQHIMVMFFEQDDGTVSDAIIVKHWRQDWKYQDKTIHEFVGNNTWEKQNITWNDRKGTWSQTVYQVDDSPRYEGFGEWKHFANSSSWISSETKRPLPRREATIRDDYDIVIGTNIHTITPNGWVHEQNNNKATLDNQVIAKEIGLARYQRIDNFDWSAGYEYWDETSEFWKKVREVWSKKIEKSKKIKVNSDVDGNILFARLFGLAEDFKNGNLETIEKVEPTIDEHIEKSESGYGNSIKVK
tara:strand:+ start:242 stop:1366 length:1125 start_codon:yes stop_codon:yes gene_type:complete